MTQTSGIYLITCRPPGQPPLYYVGQSVDVHRRIGQHKTSLRYERHRNPRLQRYWDRYGESAFTFELLEQVAVADLDSVEHWWLTRMVGSRRCFNIAADPTAPTRGKKFTETHKRRIAEALSGENHYSFGRSLSEEHRAKISASGLGLKRSQITRQRIAAANTGPLNFMFGKTGAQNAKSRPVEGFDIVTGVTLRYESATLAERDGYSQESISRVCNGKAKTHKGLSWRFTPPNLA